MNRLPLGRVAGQRRAAILGLLASVVVGACVVGPNFKTPAAPAAAGDSYTPTPVPNPSDSAPGLDGDAQRYLVGQDIPAQWWTLFHSPALDQLIRDALAHSPSLESAQAALRQAQETLHAETGSRLYPAVNGQAGAERQRSTSSGIPGVTVYNLYNAGVNVSYAVDAFGASRRALESLAAGVEFQRFQAEATYLTLASNVVTTAIREASLRAQLQATNEVLDAQQKQLDLVDKQFGFGAVPRTTVLAQRTAVAQTRASLPALEKSLAQAQHQLSVYAGRLPSEAGMPAFDLAALQLPPELPLSLPSSLVRQRPDIRASEALLHEASAQVGVATANQYPQINLSATLGTGGLKIDQLFKTGSTVWSVASTLTQPIFNGGALSARKRAAQAAYEQADAQYRGVVLAAFQNVADSLRAIEFDAAALKSSAETEAFARDSLDLSTKQYKLGASSYLSLLDAQRTYQQTRIALVQAKAARLADSAALLQALGGGWWQRPELADLANAAPPAGGPPPK